MRPYCGVITLSLGDGPELPTEFRLFKAGVNETAKGPIIFDSKAAKTVMAHYKAQGVEIMIDLNHDSLEELPLAMRTDASDARGWFQLELRGGELWATNVRWTPDGAERLKSRKQRYISPAFTHETIEGQKSRRVVALVNAALCAMPATHGATPLVATLEARVRGAQYLAKVRMTSSAKKRSRP